MLIVVHENVTAVYWLLGVGSALAANACGGMRRWCGVLVVGSWFRISGKRIPNRCFPLYWELQTVYPSQISFRMRGVVRVARRGASWTISNLLSSGTEAFVGH